jgi:hypothetical protein
MLARHQAWLYDVTCQRVYSASSSATSHRKEHPEYRQSPEDVLEAVSTHEPCGVVHGCVKVLRHFGHGVGPQGAPQPWGTQACAAVEEKHQRHQEHRQELDDRVRPEIASAVELGPVPVPDRGDSREDQRPQQDPAA